MNKAYPFVLSVLFLSGCDSEVTPILGCDEGHGITPVCNMQNPEDLARIGSSSFLVVSQYGGMDGLTPGSIAIFDTRNNTFEVVFPADDALQPESGWGAQSCAVAPDQRFSPHGIDLETVNGRQRLLVVNHGGRESVEFFEIVNEPIPGRPFENALSDGGAMDVILGLPPRLIWRGCVLADADLFFNDVVNLSNGGFLATHMMPRSEQISSNLKGLFGADTGYVVEWVPQQGFKKVAGTDAPFPNGIEISEDESTLFVNIYLAGEVRKISRRDGSLLGRVEVSGPDNVTWSDDGRLLVASHVDSIAELMACNGITEGNCGFGFEIVSIDPETMTRETLFSHRGAPMGGVTVALTIEDRIYFGTFAGDRMAYIEKP